MPKVALSFFLFIFFAGVSSVSCDLNKEKAESWELIKKCKTLKLDMTYEEVVNIMGEPTKKIQFEKNGTTKERIYYPSPELSSTSTQFLFDKENNKVEEIICGEDFILPKE